MSQASDAAAEQDRIAASRAAASRVAASRPFPASRPVAAARSAGARRTLRALPARAFGRTRVSAWLPVVVLLAILAGGWELYAVHNRYVIPTIQQIVASLGDHPGLYLRGAGTTLSEALVGAAAGMGSAFVLAVVIAHARVVERAALPLAVVLNVTPVIAVAPGLVVAFGFGETPKYVITAIVVFFPFLMNSLTGLRSVDPLALDVFHTLHASRSEVLWRLRLPSSLPFLCAGARICMPLSLIGAVVSELVAAGRVSGLGTLIMTAASSADLSMIYASVAVLSVLGIALFLVVAAVQSRVLRWHSSETVQDR